MSYIDDAITSLRAELPQVDPTLLELYTLLMLAKGTGATPADVHNAWGIYRRATRPNDPAMVPFDDLTPHQQAQDAPFLLGIHRAACTLPANLGTFTYRNPARADAPGFPDTTLDRIAGDDLASLLETVNLFSRLEGPLGGRLADLVLRWLTSTLLLDPSYPHDPRLHYAFAALALRAAESSRDQSEFLHKVALHHAAMTGRPDEVVGVLQVIADDLAERGHRQQAADLIQLATGIAGSRISPDLAATLALHHTKLRESDGPAVAQ